jgi:hypothetical protein
MGRIPRMLAELLASDDPRTSWSFQSVMVSTHGHLGLHRQPDLAQDY